MEEIMKKPENLLPKDITFVKPQQQMQNANSQPIKIWSNTTITTSKSNEKEITKSVAVNPLRSKFRKSQTCGSLFAKCDCNPPTSPSIKPTATTTPITSTERRALFQSYSHPDTPFIFTNANKNPLDSPTGGSGESVNKNREQHFSTKDGTVIISNPKRLSSPNIGNYALLDVEIHPEIVLKVTKPAPRRVVSESPIKAKLSIDGDEDFAGELIDSLSRISSRRTLSENSAYSNHSYSYPGKGPTDDVFEDDESADFVEPIKVKPTEEISPFSFLTQPQTNFNHKFQPISNNLNGSTTPTTEADTKATHNNLEYLKYNALSYQQENLLNIDSAARFFQESGILGPIMGNGVSTRKSSKIQDSTNLIEQV